MIGHSSQINIDSQPLTCLHVGRSNVGSNSQQGQKYNRIRQQQQERKLSQQETTVNFTQDAIEEERILKPRTSEEPQVVPLFHTSHQTNHSTNIELRESKRCNLDSNSNSDFDSEQQRKTKRLLAMFRLWQSKTEMNNRQIQHRNNNVINLENRACNSRDGASNLRGEYVSTLSSNLNLSQQSTSNSCNYHHITRHNHLMFVPTSAANIPFATNIMPDNLSESISERKLWQTLVMPLVLGCIIFLIVIWTRQISLVLMDDTIVMIVILGSVFILMSGIAFWLAQDQSMTESECDEQEQQRAADANHNHHHHHYYHHHNQSNSRNSNCRYQNHRSSDANHIEDANKRHCNVSVIECQPPDYYSAMKNSFPVDIYTKELNKNSVLELTNNRDGQNDQKHSSIPQNIDPTAINSSINELDLPPSYHEWSISRNSTGDYSLGNHLRR